MNKERANQDNLRAEALTVAQRSVKDGKIDQRELNENIDLMMCQLFFTQDVLLFNEILFDELARLRTNPR